VARQIKRTVVTVVQSRLEEYKGDVLALGLFKDTQRVPKDYAGLDKAAGGVVSKVLKLGDFSGKANESAVIYHNGAVVCRRIMLIGLGGKDDFDLNILRQAAGTAARKSDELGASRLGLGLHIVLGGKLDPVAAGQAQTEGAIAGRYDYQDYLPADRDDVKQAALMRVALLDPAAASARQLKQGSKVGTVLAEAQNRARQVANKPGNEVNPAALARQSQRWARQFGLKCRVFDEGRLAEMQMNAILAVGSGSASKPRLIILEYDGRRGGRGKKSNPEVVVVGKAITFDSGGISLKPSAKMEQMKFDKCGGCAVLGIMTGLAELKLPLRVVGLIPSAENLPSQTSYRPGDIVRTYSGKTVEVQNTDAEGRMILCDALSYAAGMKPGAIIDMATLTGACAIALGEHYAGLFSNDQALGRKLKGVSEVSGEAVWLMPSGSEYLEQMRSKVADLKNVGGREGGACTAAAFLGAFVSDVPWAHIDIAAVADTDKAQAYRGLGATGFAVRLVLEYLRKV